MEFRRAMVATLAVFILGVAVVPIVSSEHKFPLNSKNYNAENISHDLILGYIRRSDRLLLNQTIDVPSKFLRIVTEDVYFPLDQSYRAVIDAIVVRDLKTDGTGGFPSIVNGGIRQNNVTIRLNSQRGRGLNFRISIYGR